MRVIVTEMYFDNSLVKWTDNKEQKNPGLAAAWLRVDDRGLGEERFSGAEPTGDELYGLLDQKFARFPSKEPEKDFLFLADLSIQNVPSERADELLSTFHARRLYNYEIANSVLDADIVYENSPPIAKQLRKLLQKTPGAAIGTFLGYQVVPTGCEPLMFFTVPLGIIVIGSATGVATALHNGLNKWVEGKFKGKK